MAAIKHFAVGPLPFLFGVLFLLIGCATFPPFTKSSVIEPSLDAITPQTILRDVPFFAQEDHACGPAVLAMALVFSGVSITPETVTPMVFSPSLKGSLQPALVAAARRMGRVAYPITGMEALLLEVSEGKPVIVLQNLGLRMTPVWHYALVVGYDLNEKSLLLHSGTEPFKTVDLEVFRRTWQRSGNWGLLVLPTGCLPLTAELEPSIRAIIGLEKAGALQEASIGYQAVMNRWPHSLEAHIGLASCYYRLGRLSEAEAVLHNAAERFPDEGSVFNNLAMVLSLQNRTEEAIEAAQEAVRLGGPLNKVYLKTFKEVKNQEDSGDN